MEFIKIKRFLPAARRDVRLDDLLILSGIIFVIKNGLPWRQCPEIYGKWNTVYTRFHRWSKKGIFEHLLECQRGKLRKHNIAMIDSTFIKAHRTSASMRSDKKPREIGRSKGGLTSKIHLLCTSDYKPLDFILTEGQVSDIKAAPELVRRNLGYMNTLLGDKAYDSNSLRDILADNKIQACIPSKENRKVQIPYDEELYKKRHVIENMFSKIKDWRGVAMRYNRCAHTCRSFISISLIFLFF